MTPNELAIRTTVAVVTESTGDPSPLISIAKRESNFHHLAVGDVRIASRVFERDREKIKAKGSPWADSPDLWAGSFGLFQMMAPYETQWWRVDAPPWILKHPVVATILAMRKWNRIIALGAKNPVDVRMVWAYGPDGLAIPKNDERYQSRVKSERQRWASLGLSGDPATMPATKYLGAGMGGETSTQEADLHEICRRLGISPTEVPPEDWRPSTMPPTSQPGEQASTPRRGSPILGLALGALSVWLLSRLA